ncbi:MAG: 4-hydroxy-3-methylbut-2-enyl diphosphate reductase [Candidatus Omnitrophota bacterium]
MKKKKLKVIKARCAGFCFGVKRAVGVAEKFLTQRKTAYSLGPIIHNPSVVSELSKKGLEVISDIKKARRSYILIRSHGIAPRLMKEAKALSIGMIDATCPFVKRSHRIVTMLKKEGYKIIIVGERSHPEIRALTEVAGRSCKVIAKESDLKKLKLSTKKIAAVAQTTLSRDNFLKITSSMLDMDCFEFRIFDTICSDVVKRQTEAKQLAKRVELILVVGGKISANTRHLANICKDAGAKTHHIETERELKPSWFKSGDSIGVISGASTPENIVDRVVSKLKSM